MEKSTRRKNLIKNIIIGFLVALLFLTFFSNTILNWSLVEVETSIVKDGSIDEVIRSTTTIEAMKKYEVTLPQSREIKEVHISLGDEVQAGDLLFTLTEAENEELEMAEAELAQLKIEYNSALLDDDLPSYAADDAEVQALQMALSKATTERNALGTTTKTLTQAQSGVDNAQNNVDTWTIKSNAVQTKITQVDNGDAAYSVIRNEVSALNEANNNLEKQQAVYDSIVLSNGGQTHTEVSAEIQTLQNEIDGMADDNNKIFAQNELTKLQIKYSTLYQAYEELEIVKATVTAAKIELNEKKEAERKLLLQENDGIQKNLNKAQTELQQAKSNYDMVRQIKEAEDAVDIARSALNTKILTLAEIKDTDKITKQKNALTLEDKQNHIEIKEAEIEDIRASQTDVLVKAKYNGIVSTINIKGGSTVLEDEVLAEIDVVSDGFEAEISVSKTHAENITLGQDANVKVNTYSEIEAKVTGIRTDVTNPDQKLIVLQIDGDVSVGQQVSVSIPLSSQHYDTIVPKNAVHQEQSGYFVLILTAKNTALGNRYVAEKVPVEVLKQDDSMVAINGGVSYGDYIVGTSSGSIEPGDYVRMSVNATGGG